MRVFWRRDFRLRTTFLLFVLVPVVLILGIGVYVGLSALERELERRMQVDVELVARSIDFPLVRALRRGGEELLRRTLESAVAINRIYSAAVYDVSGNLILSLGKEKPEVSHSRMSRIAAKGVQKGEYGRLQSSEVYSFFVPLNDQVGRNIGMVQLTRERRSIDSDIRSFRWAALGLIGLVVAVIVIAGFVAHRRSVERPITELIDTMRRVQYDGLSTRAPMSGPREIADLADAFNRMLERLGSAKQELMAGQRRQSKLEHRLKHAEKLAATGRLAAGVAHELGTPLSVIDGIAQRGLRSPGEGTEKTQSRFEDIRFEVRRLESIVRQLMEFSRRDGASFKSVSLAESIRSAAISVSDLVAEADVRLEVSEGKSDVRVTADPIRIEQAWVNLLRNAIESAESGRVRISWQVKEGSQIEVAVEDDGVGVDDELKSKIFEPFFTTKGVGRGIGLGLSLVHGIVEELGGSVEAYDSDDLGGACFRVVLPMEAMA